VTGQAHDGRAVLLDQRRIPPGAGSATGNIASFNPSRHLLSIMFHRGSEIPGEHPRLEGDGKLVRTMRFADLDQLEAGRADLEAVIRAWCDARAGSAGPA
jgi:hypothetical protein